MFYSLSKPDKVIKLALLKCEIAKQQQIKIIIKGCAVPVGGLISWSICYWFYLPEKIFPTIDPGTGQIKYNLIIYCSWTLVFIQCQEM